MRRAAKRDSSETEIVAAIEKAGWQVFRSLPADLLCFKAGVWKVLEAKSPRNQKGDPRHDKRQKAQAEFLSLTSTPVVVTPQQALDALERTC